MRLVFLQDVGARVQMMHRANTIWEERGKTTTCKPKREVSEVTSHADNWILNVSLQDWKKVHFCHQLSSGQLLSYVRLFVTPWTAACQTSLPSPTPSVYSNSCPLSRWCHPTISSSVSPFSACPQSFPGSGSFQKSQFFATGGQSIGGSASASILPMNIQDWSPLGWTGWISLQFKGLSRVFSNTTVQKHQLFGAQLSL